MPNKTKKIESPEVNIISQIDGLVEEALKIGEKRREILRQLNQALSEDDLEAVKKYASELCGFIA